MSPEGRGWPLQKKVSYCLSPPPTSELHSLAAAHFSLWYYCTYPSPVCVCVCVCVSGCNTVHFNDVAVALLSCFDLNPYHKVCMCQDVVVVGVHFTVVLSMSPIHVCWMLGISAMRPLRDWSVIISAVAVPGLRLPPTKMEKVFVIQCAVKCFLAVMHALDSTPRDPSVCVCVNLIWGGGFSTLCDCDRSRPSQSAGEHHASWFLIGWLSRCAQLTHTHRASWFYERKSRDHSGKEAEIQRGKIHGVHQFVCVCVCVCLSVCSSQ